jgi:hypothetical protein
VYLSSADTDRQADVYRRRLRQASMEAEELDAADLLRRIAKIV